MKKHITVIILILLFVGFSIFVFYTGRYKTVVSVDSPDKIGILASRNKNSNKSENICIDNAEIFSISNANEIYDKYSSVLKISKTDVISLGYLSQEFAQKTLLNRKVHVIYTPKDSEQCRYARVKINGIDFGQFAAKKGFALINGKIISEESYLKNLEVARKLNLVILNHHSNKYHTLDCPYGNASHDFVIIPSKQLPENTIPCKFCHDINSKLAKNNQNRANINSLLGTIRPALYIADGSIEVYYTDYTKTSKPDTNCRTTVCKRLLNLINNTKNSIDIAIYGYENIPQITSALTSAKARGVNIRFVYDENYNPSRDYYKDNSVITSLSNEFRSDKTLSQEQSNIIMHNKFIIFDDNTVFTGSMNISRSGLSDFDVNDIIILHSKNIAYLYKKEIEQMIQGRFHKNKIQLSDNRKFVFNNTEIEVYFSPKDRVSTRICEVIDGAKTYIYVPTFLITHKNISEALVRAKNRGVDVRVIIDANSISLRNTKHKFLRDNSIMLKTENFAGKLHSKAIIIDDKYLITGSMNFSNSGENKNDENILIIKNQKIASSHKQFFLYLWTLIPNKYLKYNAKPESPDSIGSCFDGIDNNFNGKIDMEEPACIQSK